MMAWFTGMATPLILMLIGAPTETKMSDAFLSAMIWNSRFIADMELSLGVAAEPAPASLIPPEKFVQAGLRAGLGIDFFDNHRTVKAVLAIRGGQITGNHHGTGRHAPVEDLSALPVEDAGALPEVDAHRKHAVCLHDHALDHLRARADEAVVLDDHRVRLHRLEHAADADAAGEVHVLADLR